MFLVSLFTVACNFWSLIYASVLAAQLHAATQVAEAIKSVYACESALPLPILIHGIVIIFFKNFIFFAFILIKFLWLLY